jgi:hypothetical protein
MPPAGVRLIMRRPADAAKPDRGPWRQWSGDAERRGFVIRQQAMPDITGPKRPPQNPESPPVLRLVAAVGRLTGADTGSAELRLCCVPVHRESGMRPGGPALSWAPTRRQNPNMPTSRLPDDFAAPTECHSTAHDSGPDDYAKSPHDRTSVRGRACVPQWASAPRRAFPNPVAAVAVVVVVVVVVVVM